MFRNLILIMLVAFVLPTLSKDLKFKNLEDLAKCARNNTYDTGVCYEPLLDKARLTPLILRRKNFLKGLV